MRIPRVHVDAELVVGDEISLDPAQSHYLKHVLRLKSGAAVVLFSGRDAIDYDAVLSISGKQASARIDSLRRLDNESLLQSEILQGLARADHLDWMIQKTTELGVGKITIFNAERSQSPLKSAAEAKKIAHWRAVAVSACEQSGRAIVPTIAFYNNLEPALADSSGSARLLLDFSGGSLASGLPAAQKSVAILLGPEGGLHPSEIRLARASGFTSVHLGPRVLRTETAAITALALAQARLGDLC